MTNQSEPWNYPAVASQFAGGPCLETFEEYGLVYEKRGHVPRSTWTSDPGEVAREFRRVARYSEEQRGTDYWLGEVSIVQRTVTYSTTAWEKRTVEELDQADEERRGPDGGAR